MPKSARQSQTPRATYCRQWRELSREKKRFNTPLKEYIQMKYENIYDEYCLFYKGLDEQHPAARDLTKTSTFRKWKKQFLKQEPGESELEDEQENLAVEADRTEPFVARVEDLPVETDRPELDMLSTVVQETLPGGNYVNINEAANVDNIIQQIINDLEQDEAIQDILNQPVDDELVQPNYQEEDEGIGLNVETELEAIIEPFDYNLEVEGFDF